MNAHRSRGAAEAAEHPAPGAGQRWPDGQECTGLGGRRSAGVADREHRHAHLLRPPEGRRERSGEAELGQRVVPVDEDHRPRERLPRGRPGPLVQQAQPRRDDGVEVPLELVRAGREQPLALPAGRAGRDCGGVRQPLHPRPRVDLGRREGGDEAEVVGRAGENELQQHRPDERQRRGAVAGDSHDAGVREAQDQRPSREAGRGRLHCADLGHQLLVLIGVHRRRALPSNREPRGDLRRAEDDVEHVLVVQPAFPQARAGEPGLVVGGRRVGVGDERRQPGLPSCDLLTHAGQHGAVALAPMRLLRSLSALAGPVQDQWGRERRERHDPAGDQEHSGPRHHAVDEDRHAAEHGHEELDRLQLRRRFDDGWSGQVELRALGSRRPHPRVPVHDLRHAAIPSRAACVHRVTGDGSAGL